MLEEIEEGGVITAPRHSHVMEMALRGITMDSATTKTTVMYTKVSKYTKNDLLALL